MNYSRVIRRIKERQLSEDTSAVGIFAEPGVEGGVQLSDEEQARFDRLKAEIVTTREEVLKSRYGESWEEVAGAVASKVIAESKLETYYNTYSEAVQAALTLIPSTLSYDEDEYFQIVASGTKKPGRDQTTRFNLPLYNKAGKHVKLLVVSVYNRGSDRKEFELTAYVS